ncbi:unnamed protein product [Sphagnum balticum]
MISKFLKITMGLGTAALLAAPAFALKAPLPNSTSGGTAVKAQAPAKQLKGKKIQKTTEMKKAVKPAEVVKAK